ncbi:MAG: hypothetical protein K2P68_06810, partial [Sphingomonas sp.]|nr:hypothetical protein [Sphingomonas sp.]
TNPALTYRVGATAAGTGLVNGDTLAGMLETSATTVSNVGRYDITQGSLTAGSNYALSYTGAQLAVTPRGLTITADPLSRIYGDANPALTYRVGGLGLVNGDTLAGLLSTSATTASNIGSYDITQGSLTGGSNYALSYSGAQLAVTPRGLTITADPLSRIYGDANPALTYRVGATGAGTGLVNGDTLSGLLATSANTTSNVGSYDITQGTLTAGGNYAISYSGAQLAVTPRALTITADPLSRIYGDANPALTYRVGATAAGTGLVNGHTLAGMLATSATTTSNVGSYDITQGSLTASSNYALTYVPASLTVLPRAKPPTPLFSSTFVKQWTDTYIIYEAGNLEDLPSGLYRSLAVLRTPEFLPLRVCRKDISCGDDYLAVRRHQTARSEADLAVRDKDGENSTRH